MVARDDLCIFLLNEELFGTPESSKSQGSYNDYCTNCTYSYSQGSNHILS